MFLFIAKYDCSYQTIIFFFFFNWYSRGPCKKRSGNTALNEFRFFTTTNGRSRRKSSATCVTRPLRFSVYFDATRTNSHRPKTVQMWRLRQGVFSVRSPDATRTDSRGRKAVRLWRVRQGLCRSRWSDVTRTHSQPYGCDVCCKVFARKDTLKRHA